MVDFEESTSGDWLVKIAQSIYGIATSIRDLRVLKMLEGYASCMCWMHKRCSAVVEVN